jgi:UDP:flavonoid glycosyltransferase YjiC (YdhE family)
MTILVLMADAIGHINGTFSFCQELKARGARVVYGVKAEMQASVQAQGFETMLSINEFFFKRGGLGLEKSSWLEKVSENIADRLTGDKETLTRSIAQQLDLQLAKLNPDVVLLDSFLSHNYFLLNLRARRVFLIQTMLSTARREGVPPLYSRLNTIANAWEMNLNWQMIKFKNKLQRWLVLERGLMSTLLKVAKGRKPEILAALDNQRSFRPGIKGIAEIIMAPRAFDLPEFGAVLGQYYAGTQLNRNRQEAVFNKAEVTLQERMDANKDETWIYCSLGTLNLLHNPQCLHFIEKVLEVFRQKPEWKLVLATGMIEARQLGKIPDNVWVYKRVPQLELLKRCKLIITHGGLNSVLEAIDQEVPLLVYPLNEKWDQNGNATRVVHYGLGLKGRMRTANSHHILDQVNQLLNEDSFRQNLKAFKQRIDAEKGIEEIMELVFQKTNTASKQKIAQAIEE